MSKTYINTVSGNRLDFLAIDDAAFDLHDIAHSLSQLARFTGHCARGYTVAHHSLLVAELVEAPFKLQALFHDAHESFVGDVSTPLKDAIGEVAFAFGCKVNPYRWIEDQVATALRKLAELPPDLHPAVKAADKLAFEIEYAAFWKGEFNLTLNSIRHKPRSVAGREWFLAVSELLERKGVTI